jgi:hypothetical protein
VEREDLQHRLSASRVSAIVRSGELQTVQIERGERHVPQRVVHNRRQQAPVESSPPYTTELQYVDEHLVELQHQLSCAGARAELTELAQGTVRKERDRLLQELKFERTELRKVRDQLEAKRGIGFWQRLFRG